MLHVPGPFMIAPLRDTQLGKADAEWLSWTSTAFGNIFILDGIGGSINGCEVKKVEGKKVEKEKVKREEAP